jgi:fatty acid desaturase
MELTFNWLATILATIVGMIIAGVWYSKAFGNAWIKLTGVTKKDSKKAGKTPMVVLLVTNFIFAAALTGSIAVATAFFENSSLWFVLFVGFVLWFGFSATTLLQHNSFELKPVKLTLINNGYQLVLFLGMALVIGLIK